MMMPKINDRCVVFDEEISTYTLEEFKAAEGTLDSVTLACWSTWDVPSDCDSVTVPKPEDITETWVFIELRNGKPFVWPDGIADNDKYIMLYPLNDKGPLQDLVPHIPPKDEWQLSDTMGVTDEWYIPVELDPDKYIAWKERFPPEQFGQYFAE